MKVIFLNTRNLRNKNLILFFFQNLNIQTLSEITEPELKISEPGSKYKNSRMDSTPLYRNTRPNPNPNVFVFVKETSLFDSVLVCGIRTLPNVSKDYEVCVYGFSNFGWVLLALSGLHDAVVVCEWYMVTITAANYIRDSSSTIAAMVFGSNWDVLDM